MKIFISTKTIRLFGGMVASAVLASGIVQAADTPAPAQTTQGSGASKLSSDSEGAKGMGKSKMSMRTDAKSFLKDAIQGNSSEIAMAQVAERKTQSAELRQFAQTIRKEHEQANQQLQSLAQAHGVPATQPLDSKHQKKLDHLQQLSGAEFDREYAKEMLKDHQKDIAKYEHASRNIQETDIQQYVQATLPKLRQHLQHAQQTARSVGVDQATISSIMDQSHPMGGSNDDALEKSTDRDKSDSKIKDKDLDL
jgi:putative membrane protein